MGLALVASTVELAQTVAPEQFASPTIDRLKQGVARGNRLDINSFWKDIQQTNAPLVEPLATDPASVLVTFVWRGTSGTRNVLIDWGTFQRPFPGSSPRSNLLTRIGDTDLWYRTFKFPRDARFMYRLSPNDPLRFKDYESKGPPSQLDPLNPRQRLGWSLVELPSAPPQPYAQQRPGGS